MQNEYVADIGDYGKFALLVELCADELRLLVIWYLTREEVKSSDGKFRGYLRDDEFRKAAPRIFDALKEISSSMNDRNVGAVEGKRVLPTGTDFYKDELSYRNLSPGERKRHRDEWFAAAVAKVKKADLIFLDPDNGLEVNSRGPYSKKGIKYATVEEVKALLAEKKSVVLYQHRNHSGKIEDQIEDVFSRLKIGAKEPFGWAISFHTFSTRIYFVFPTPDHASWLEPRLIEFCKYPNNQVFKLRGHRLSYLG